jgi:hypothetical protein
MTQLLIYKRSHPSVPVQIQHGTSDYYTKNYAVTSTILQILHIYHYKKGFNRATKMLTYQTLFNRLVLNYTMAPNASFQMARNGIYRAIPTIQPEKEAVVRSEIHPTQHK